MQRPPPPTNRPNRPVLFDTRANQAPIRPPSPPPPPRSNSPEYITALGIVNPPLGSTGTSPAYSTDYEFNDPSIPNGEETFTTLDRM